ncbi:hypothetical protein HMI56_003741 [Coelomomyces lativittatus]|nr:hypothetical protein HMI56_003741 [Coelomomyces lativittatus]
MTHLPFSTSSESLETCLSRYFVILDCSLQNWAILPNPKAFQTVLDQLCLYLNAYLACNHDNQLVLLGVDTKESRYLFPCQSSSDGNDGILQPETKLKKREGDPELPETISNESLPPSTTSSPPDPVKTHNAYQPFYQMNQIFLDQLKQWLVPPERTSKFNGSETQKKLTSQKYTSAHFSSALSKMLSCTFLLFT